MQMMVFVTDKEAEDILNSLVLELVSEVEHQYCGNKAEIIRLSKLISKVSGEIEVNKARAESEAQATVDLGA